jgi:acyl transferase domain-containing protein/acyl carrier protein
MLMNADAIQSWLVSRLSELLQVPPEEISLREPLVNYGIDSLQTIRLSGELENWLGRRLDPTLVYEYTNLENLARYLAHEPTPTVSLTDAPQATTEPIAIIGIGCRFPGASGPDAFWQLLLNGTDAISEVQAKRWDPHVFYHSDPAVPGKTSTRWGGFLNEVDSFDPYFFGIPPGEAKRMDPQQRLLLEVAYEALEDAGLPLERLSGTRTGVFVGISANEYSDLLISNPQLIDGHSGTGNALSIVANRISYVFDLRGPSLAVDTACSSSLVAVHLACRSLRAGESQLALAGGVNLILSPNAFIALTKAGVLAPDGRCKSFDARANGYARGEGAGMVVLKPLTRALMDGDSVYAVIRGSALNQDGRTNGLMAPSREAQEALLLAAYHDAGVSPNQVQYIEAHGTGTLLGDPIEAKALGAVLSANWQSGSCAIGSVKSNIGHLEAAAGIAGLIKVALSMKHRLLPPSLHFEHPNPYIPFNELGLRVQTSLTPWPSQGTRALAGVSSFGFGGTNAHVVVEQATFIEKTPGVNDADGNGWHLLPLSARSSGALRSLANAYRQFLVDSTFDTGASLMDICFTASTRRSHYEHRLAVIGRSNLQLVERLDAFLRGNEEEGGVFSGRVHSPDPEFAPLALSLANGETNKPPLHGDEELREALLQSLAARYTQAQRIDWTQLYPSGGQYVSLPSYPWQHRSYWVDTGKTPLTSQWNRYKPKTHPLLGEQVRLAYPPGAAVWQTTLDSQLLPYLGDHRIEGEIILPASAYLEMALQVMTQANIAHSHVLSEMSLSEKLVLRPGEPRQVQVMLFPGEDGAASLGVYSRSADTQQENWISHANGVFLPDQLDRRLMPRGWTTPATLQLRCTEQVAPDDFYQDLWERGIQYGYNLRGVEQVWRGDGEALGYVRLPESLHYEADEYQIHPALLDAGLQVLAAIQPTSREGPLYLPGGCRQVRWYERPGRSIWSHAVLRSNVTSSTNVVEADVRLLDDAHQIVAEILGIHLHRITSRVHHTTPINLDTWLYQVQWRPSAGTSHAEDIPTQEGKRWLILADHGGLGQCLAEQLKAQGARCRLVRYNASGSLDHTDDVKQWMDEGEEGGWYGVIHLWSIESDSLERARTLGSYAVLKLVQAVTARGLLKLPRLWLVTRGVQPVEPGDAISPLQSPLWGLGKVIGFELPDLRCTCIDLDPLMEVEESASLLIRQLFVEDKEDQVAIRHGARFVPRLLPYTLKDRSSPADTIRADSTYLITGGLGGLGLTVARWMVQRGARYIVLVGRNAPVPETEVVLTELRQGGAEIVVARADVAELQQIARVISLIQESMPPLRGIVHAAGVLSDGSLVNLTPERLSLVMAPKVDGAWNLHAATADEALDFFVLFSSAVSVLGSPGQGSYAAANTFLDALAHARHRQGLPATSINWGPWADVGMAASTAGRHSMGGRAPLYMMKVISPEHGLEALERALQEQIPQITVLPFDLRNLLELYPTAARNTVFAEVGVQESYVSHLYERPDLPQAYVAPRTEIERRLAGIWQKTLQIDQVGVHDSFFELGGDSILAADIVALTYKTFGVSISIREAFDSFTIEDFARVVEAELLTMIERLSEREVQQLLAEDTNN